MTLLIIIIWLICGFFTYGIFFAEFQGSWGEEYKDLKNRNYREDMSMSVFLGLFGPFGLLIAIFFSGFAQHGFKIK
jgi:hypothetical protein